MDARTEHRDRVLDFGGFPGHWEILESTADTDGARFRTRMKIEEAGELPPHRHPAASERYEVLSGTLHVLEGDAWSVLEAGDSHEVPPGVAHAFRTEGPVELINVHEPAMRYEEYFHRFHALKVDRGVDMPPRSFRGMVLLGMLQAAYEPEFVGVRPPQAAFRLFAWLGRVLGYRLPT